jgi:hypothetical protein
MSVDAGIGNNNGGELGGASMVVDELERLRAAARHAALELERVRGPVAPPLPARPPAFWGRM